MNFPLTSFSVWTWMVFVFPTVDAGFTRVTSEIRIIISIGRDTGKFVNLWNNLITKRRGVWKYPLPSFNYTDALARFLQKALPLRPNFISKALSATLFIRYIVL